VAAASPFRWDGVLGLLPGAFLVMAITLGQMLLVPAARALVPDLVDDRHLGLAMGALSSVSGLLVLVGSSATGSLLGQEGVLLWGVLACVPLAGALLARCLRLDGRTAG
jgi:MFS family permease